MKLLKIKNMTAANISKAMWFLGLHSFRFIIALVILDLILGAAIFYKYAYLAEVQEPQAASSIIKFDEKTYLQVVDEINERRREFEEIK